MKKNPRLPRPPEKRLFHKPITPVKIAVYCAAVLLIAVIAVAGRFVYVTLIDGRAAFEDTAPTPPPAATQTDVGAAPSPTVTLSPEERLKQQADRDFMQDRVNILLTGIDYSAEREGRKDFRTDTIMLFSVNFATGSVDILSIPRDSYADIAFTDTKWKINGAWMSAGGFDGQGFECLMQTVSTTIGGIPVGYYMAVDMQAVKDIVDIIGGVWYDVDYDITMNGRHIEKGYQLLDGQAVLDYCRARKGITSGTDIDRIDRQQRLLLEVFRQVKETDLLPKIPDIYASMSANIHTNLNIEQIAALAFFALDLDPDTEMSRHALKGQYMRAYNASYYVLDHAYTTEVIHSIFGVTPEIDWTYDIAYVAWDAAAENLAKTADKARRYLNDHQKELPSELIDTAESQLASADKLCRDADNRLKKARKANSNDKLGKPDKLDDASKRLTALYDNMVDAALHPTPTPMPQTPAPQTPAPQTPAPQTPAPQTPAPQTPAPQTPEPPPETSQPVDPSEPTDTTPSPDPAVSGA